MPKRRKRRPIKRRRKRNSKGKQLPGWLLLITRVFLMLLIICGISWYVLLAYVDRQITSNPNSRHLLFYSQDISNNSHLMVIHLAPNATQATAYIIDSDETVEVTGGYGEYPLRAMPGLLRLDHSDHKEQTTLISLTLGQVIDSVYQVDLDIQPPLEEVGLKRIIHKINNEAWDGWQKFKMSRMLSIVPESRFVYNPELISLSDYIEAAKSDYPLNVCSVAVVNTTNVNGVAKKYTQLMENSGITVYRTTSQADPADKTQILMDNNASADCLLTLDRIEPTLKNATLEVQDDLVQEYRADIVVLVGEDISTYLE